MDVWLATWEENDYDWFVYDVIGVYSTPDRAKDACQERANEAHKKEYLLNWIGHPEHQSANGPKPRYGPTAELNVHKVVLDEYVQLY